LLNPHPTDRLRTVAALFQRFRQTLQVLLQVRLKHPDRHPVHSRAPLVALHLGEGRLQVGQRADLVDQAVPLASFDPHFEGRQHALGPDTRFHPAPSALGLSGLFSPCWHLRRFGFQPPGPHASTFLSPFAPRPLRRLSARMGTVTPRQVSRPTEVSPLHVTRLFGTILPPTTRHPPSPLSHATPQLDGSPLAGARLHHWLAGSPSTSGRIKFVLLRTGPSPPVALHPASRRRSYLRFPGRRAYAWRGLSPLYVCARERTSPGREPWDR